MCDDVVVMKGGKIVDRGSPQKLLEAYGRENMEEVFLDIARNRNALKRPMISALPRRLWGLVLRHVYLYMGSWPRFVEMLYWPAHQYFNVWFYQPVTGA